MKFPNPYPSRYASCATKFLNPSDEFRSPTSTPSPLLPPHRQPLHLPVWLHPRSLPLQTIAASTTPSTSPLLHSCINFDSIETVLQVFDGVRQRLIINVATFEKPLRKLTFAHLVETTNDFSVVSLVGSGGLGEVFIAKFADGSVVAVKKLVSANGQGDREFTAEREATGNLVPLLGYCKVGEARLLVYEYMKLGSLDIVLQTKPEFLDGATRKRIAMAFLHHSCIPHATHRDMKSSNVLLDENLEAQVFDFSMARPMNAIDAHLSLSTQQKDK